MSRLVSERAGLVMPRLCTKTNRTVDPGGRSIFDIEHQDCRAVKWRQDRHLHRAAAPSLGRNLQDADRIWSSKKSGRTNSIRTAKRTSRNAGILPVSAVLTGW